jgi:hypothetical protein
MGTVRPWATGLSGQLQKAFVTGMAFSYLCIYHICGTVPVLHQCFLRNLEGPGPYSEYIKSNKKEKEKDIEVTIQETKKETKKIKRSLLYTRVCVLNHNVIIIFLGVPSLKRSELETACEDFSNIIGSTSTCMLYKGTLSSGVEIAVASSLVTSAKDWSKENESQYRKKVLYSYLQSARYTTFLILIDEK